MKAHLPAIRNLALVVAFTSLVSWFVLRIFSFVVTSHLMVVADAEFVEMHQGVSSRNQQTVEIVSGVFHDFSIPLAVIGCLAVVIALVATMLDRARR